MPKNDTEWHKQETYKSMMDYGQNMLRFIFLVNGGAILAILTFIGHLADNKTPAPNMNPSIVWFLIGLLFAGIAAGTAYWTQLTLFGETINDYYHNAKDWKSHVKWLKVTMVLIAISLAAFAIGSLTAIAELK